MSDWRDAVGAFFAHMEGRNPQELERLREEAWGDDSLGQHRPIWVGGRDDDGFRTFEPQGEICERCTARSPDGRLVPVSECWQAMAISDAEG